MKIDSLDELGAAFAAWREGKKHPREAVPDDLIAWAQRSAKKHGVKAVVRVTRIERARLFRSQPGRRAAQAATRGQGARSTSVFTRLELGAPPALGPRPLAEIETAAGVRLRVFEGTPEMMGLLSVICMSGDAR
ncbi:MAG: hypothetical protein HC834_05180 [Rhodospirillales bacterium]|nr:hypothetical protein [Rhodospirillales bacterium]